MRGFMIIAALFAMVTGFAMPVRADDQIVLPRVSFRATAVQTAGAYRHADTIFYSNGKLRIDRGMGFATSILDLDTQTECILMANHTYLIRALDPALIHRFFAPNPELMSERKLGTGTISGFQTTRYTFYEDDGLKANGSYSVSNDGIMLRRDYQDGLFGQTVLHADYVDNVTIGPQPESLFKIPAGYRMAK